MNLAHVLESHREPLLRHWAQLVEERQLSAPDQASAAHLIDAIAAGEHIAHGASLGAACSERDAQTTLTQLALLAEASLALVDTGLSMTEVAALTRCVHEGVVSAAMGYVEAERERTHTHVGARLNESVHALNTPLQSAKMSLALLAGAHANPARKVQAQQTLRRSLNTIQEISNVQFRADHVFAADEL